MQIERQTVGDVTVITLDGSLDSSTAPRARLDLEKLVPDGGRVLLDLSRTSYMSSAGLRVLLTIYRQSQRTGARVALTGVPPEMREIMAATGFLTFFSVSDTVQHGVQELTA
ncbi:STAS domain-containing protein [Allonocardiopsis opalescens]|uniref:Anti-sigma factor antagonist n=1 Tax=Allonocardiopsis opalescens TaxID=1144618 RepID=A0A2T0Q061_9ACTN|nr:STAS domain-containing protein [Allonocardiopsis opalescens]PRX97095.1 anti-sigma B factor antagonist [Allonocardiopsis opalescens]